jgi:serine kinase of HPr protein (carbohydrate metabolism regulator)
MQAYQATCICIGGRGVLIEGPPGSGKSSLALALIDRGAILVGDDSLLLDRRGDRIFACPHPNTRGKLEVRNLGLLDFPVAEEVRLALVLVLDEAAPRFVEAAERVAIAGCELPGLRLWPHSPVLHVRAEQALEVYGLVCSD